MDINAIKSRLTTLQATSNTKENFWKPEPGKQVVRIVPYKHNKDNPFIELFFHYSLGNNKTYMSPASFGKIIDFWFKGSHTEEEKQQN